MRIPYLPAVLLASMFLIGFTACDDDDDPATSKGSVALHIHTFAGGNEVEAYGDTLLLGDDRKIVVNTAQLYLTNFRFIKLDDSEVQGPATVLFMKQGVEEYELGEVEAGNYKGLRFDVGLSDASNASTPDPNDPALFQSTMWFGSTAQPDGFVFVNFQGAIDTTLNANSNSLAPFAYKIGTNDNRVTITMPQENHTVVPDQLDVYHMKVDYAGLFNGIVLSNPNNLQMTTPEQNNSVLAEQLVTNIATLFSYE